MQKLEGSNRLAGWGPQLLRSFRLRVHLQLLPAADLRFAAERKRHHLQRLQEAEQEAAGAAAVAAGSSALGASGSKAYAFHALRALLLRGAAGGEQLLNEEENGVATFDSSEREASSLLALPAYRLHFVSSLQQDLGRLGWGEGDPERARPSQGGPALSSDDSPLFASGQHTLEAPSSSCVLTTLGALGEGPLPSHFSQARQEERPLQVDSRRGARASEPLQQPPTNSTTPFDCSRRGSYTHTQQQQQQYGVSTGSYATGDLATETSSVNPLLNAGSIGSLVLQQQQQEQQRQQAVFLEEEMLALKEQVVELQQQQQQRQHECASAAATAAALRTRVQQLLEENAALRLQCHRARGRRGLPLASVSNQQQQQHQQQEEQERPAAGDATLEQQQEQQESQERLQQKLDVCRRELMLLAEQNERLRLRAAGVSPPP
ncbi:hypothetical protein Emag_003991 [Eimeria magna]